MLIAYATAEGELASDVGAGSGPYAKILAEEIVKPGVEAVYMFRRVQVRVRTAIGQEPWLGFSALGEVHLAGVQAEPPKLPAAPAPSVSDAERAWPWVKDSTNQAILENFIKQYGDTPQGALARARLEELKKQQVVVATPPPKALAPAKPAEPAVAVPPISNLGRCDDGVAEWFAGSQPTRRCLKPKDTFKDCAECPEVVVVPSGIFTMGSPPDEAERQSHEDPQHKVTIAKPFGVGKFEVTFAEWDACVAAGGCKHKPKDYGWGRGKRPVIDVSWDDGKEYVSWLAKKTGRPYRLLSEAEWEYAARAGTATAFSTGRTITADQANFNGDFTYAGSAKGVHQGKTIEVGSLNKPNAFGLHDMHGNASEWVEDCYQDNYNGAPTDGSAKLSASCDSRVKRGGSWLSSPRVLRSAYRIGLPPGIRHDDFGFRVARTLSAP